MATACHITERTAQGTVTDLEQAGYLSRERNGPQPLHPPPAPPAPPHRGPSARPRPAGAPHPTQQQALNRTNRPANRASPRPSSVDSLAFFGRKVASDLAGTGCGRVLCPRSGGARGHSGPTTVTGGAVTGRRDAEHPLTNGS
ncbi:hypothetical protein ACWER6_35150 [Streptomyces sp. NPDC004009]